MDHLNFYGLRLFDWMAVIQWVWVPIIFISFMTGVGSAALKNDTLTKLCKTQISIDNTVSKALTDADLASGRSSLVS